MGLPAGLFPQNARLTPAIHTQHGDGARSSNWVSMKGYDKLGILVVIAQGNAATTAITVDKALTVGGAGNVNGITMNNWWSLEDTYIQGATATSIWTKGAAGVLITSSNTGTGCSAYYIEIDGDDLVTGQSTFAAATQYDCVQLELGVSNIGNHVTASFIPFCARYAQAVQPAIDPLAD